MIDLPCGAVGPYFEISPPNKSTSLTVQYEWEQDTEKGVGIQMPPESAFC